MRVRFKVVGFSEIPDWPSNRMELIALPREGEIIEVPGMPEGQVYVRTVVWYLWGAPNENINEPFVYIVLGPKRKS